MDYRYRNDEEMKDSGVEWIGKIPKEWNISRIAKEFIIRSEKVSDKDFAPLSVTKQGILPQLESVAKSDNGDNRKKVCIGDFVINSRADRKGSCGVSKYDGSVSLICNVLTSKYLDSQYVHSLFRNYYFSEEFYRWGSGIVDDLWSTNIERMKKISIPIPNDNEDRKIAKFLDEKTAEFDSIISKKEVLIEKLKEAKKSLISEVVTGKVKVVKTSDGYELVERKKEEMKESGVEWFNKIPLDWSMSSIKYVSNIINGQVSPLEEPFCNMPHIGPENIEKFTGRILRYNLAKEDNLTSGKYLFDRGDILYGKINPQLGKAALVTFEGICSADMYPLKPNLNKVTSKFLINIILSKYFFDQSTSFPARAGIPKINREELNSIRVVLPTLKEQNIITDFIDIKEKYIINIINKTKKQIEKLKEAKQSLISEAVTGKIEILD